MTAVNRVTIHHEGAGVPRDVNLMPYGYSASVFPGGNRIWRSPQESFATLHHNHESFDIVLTGNRQIAAVTDADCLRIAQLCHQAKQLGWLVVDCTTFPHGTEQVFPPNTPTGSSPTQCPGFYTAKQFDKIRWFVAVAIRQP